MNFRNKKYMHNSIAEVKIIQAIVVHYLVDGYQSIHNKELFEWQLKRIDFYLKRSYDSSFHQFMRNKNKILPLGFNYHCTCQVNLFDLYIHGLSLKSIKQRGKTNILEQENGCN